MSDYKKEALALHKKFGGKIHIELNDPLNSIDKLKLYYTPGVAAVSTAVTKDKSKLAEYTWTGNTVAVVSDGSAVLGLGNIGPAGALPVMEGKCLLFKHLANLNAVPIVLNAHSADEIVQTIKAISVSFGGINLEDIAAPVCFEVENRLKKELPIPVFHDDQHGTAIVVLAALINAAKVTKKNLEDTQVVVSGVGAAGVAITKLLKSYCPRIRVQAVDSQGVVQRGRKDLNESKISLLASLDPNSVKGTLADALKGADIFIGVSQPNILSAQMVRSMAKDPIILAMANPDPEIRPELAKEAGAAVVATGRSDYKNQVNNALAFPGIFRGALDHHVTQITDRHKIASAEAIARLVKTPDVNQIIPGLDNPDLVGAVAAVIR